MIVRAHNTKYLASKIQPYIYQVTKEECLDLPKKVYDSRYFEMTEEQSSLYQQAKEHILLDIEYDNWDSYIIFQLFTALQQVVSGFWNNSGFRLECTHLRLDVLCDIIRSIHSNKKIIIWCKYVYSLEQIASRLSREFGRDSVALYYGALNEKERDVELTKFRNESRFFVSTLQTGSRGLTLNEAHYVIFYENSFKYADRLQAEDRCHRIGQMMPVTYIDIVCNSGIEKRIQESIAKKSNTVNDFRHKVDNVKNLSKQQLENFVREL